MATTKEVPNHVVILGLGPSMEAYVDIAKRLGGRHKMCDEVWGINAVGGVVQCDRIFHMDDVRIQMARSESKPESNIAAMLEWMKVHPGPIYTSRPHPDFPGLVEYPYEEVLNDCKYEYFNSTAAYAVAYANYLGVKEISLFGFDFTYPNAHHAEKGRACVEFHLGIAAQRGTCIGRPQNTSLLDECAPFHEKVYGYDTMEPEHSVDDDGHINVTWIPTDTAPTAEEMESRYDHSKHPNRLIEDGH